MFGLISLVTAVQGPIVMNRIQAEVDDAVRATVLSVQSLLSILVIAIAGLVSDHAGIPAAYLGLGVAIGAATLLLVVRAGSCFPARATTKCGDTTPDARPAGFEGAAVAAVATTA